MTSLLLVAFPIYMIFCVRPAVEVVMQQAVTNVARSDGRRRCNGEANLNRESPHQSEADLRSVVQQSTGQVRPVDSDASAQSLTHPDVQSGGETVLIVARCDPHSAFPASSLGRCWTTRP